MNILDLVKLKISIENFLNDKVSEDDINILAKNGYIQTIENDNQLQIIYPNKKDMKNILKIIKSKIGE